MPINAFTPISSYQLVGPLVPATNRFLPTQPIGSHRHYSTPKPAAVLTSRLWSSFGACRCPCQPTPFILFTSNHRVAPIFSVLFCIPLSQLPPDQPTLLSIFTSKHSVAPLDNLSFVPFFPARLVTGHRRQITSTFFSIHLSTAYSTLSHSSTPAHSISFTQPSSFHF